MKLGIIFALILGHASAWAKPLEKLSPKELSEKVKLFKQVSLKDVEIVTRENTPGDCGVTYDTEINIKDSETKLTRTYKFSLTRPNSEKPLALVVGVPTIVGPTMLEDSLDAVFCSANTAYVLADVMPLDFDLSKNGIHETNKTMIEGVKAIRTYLDYVSTQPFAGESSKNLIDMNRIGVLGLSNGATVATFLAATDERIKATVIMGAPGNIPHTLTYSSQSKVDEFKTVQMEHHNLKTSEEFENFLRKEISISPAQIAPLLNKSAIFQIIIDPDIVVPTEDQVELWESLDKPQRLIVEGSHKEAIMDIVFLDPVTLIEFLQKKLE